MQQKQSLELTEFMEASKAKGISDEFLVALLVKRGWPEDVVLGALGGYWERVTGTVLPERTGRVGVDDFSIHRVLVSRPCGVVSGLRFAKCGDVAASE